MPTPLQRDIPDNYLRNGRFERWNMDFWIHRGSWISTKIIAGTTTCTTPSFTVSIIAILEKDR